METRRRFSWGKRVLSDKFVPVQEIFVPFRFGSCASCEVKREAAVLRAATLFLSPPPSLLATRGNM